MREPIAPHIPPEAVHRRDRALIVVAPRVHLAARIVNVGHQDTCRTAGLEPRMVRAIHLQQGARMRLARAPRPVRAPAPSKVLDPVLPQPPPQGLHPERDPVPLGELLRRQGWPNIPIVLSLQPQPLRLQRGPVSSVRGAGLDSDA